MRERDGLLLLLQTIARYTVCWDIHSMVEREHTYISTQTYVQREKDRINAALLASVRKPGMEAALDGFHFR